MGLPRTNGPEPSRRWGRRRRRRRRGASWIFDEFAEFAQVRVTLTSSEFCANLWRDFQSQCQQLKKEMQSQSCKKTAWKSSNFNFTKSRYEGGGYRWRPVWLKPQSDTGLWELSQNLGLGEFLSGNRISFTEQLWKGVGLGKEFRRRVVRTRRFS